MSKISAFIVLVVLFGCQEITVGFDVGTDYQDALTCTTAIMNGDWWGLVLKLGGVNTGPTLGDVMSKLDTMNAIMESSFQNIADRLDGVTQTMKEMAADMKVEERMRAVSMCMAQLNRYKRMVESIREHHAEYPEQKLLANCDKITSETDRDGMVHQLELLADIVTLDKNILFDSSIYDFFKEQYAVRGFKGTCDSTASYQQKIINLHDVCVYYELQGLHGLGVAYSVMAEYTHKLEEYAMRRDMSRSIFRMQNHFLTIKAAAEDAWTEIMRCNPSKCIEGENYIQMKRLFRPIIIREDFAESNSECKKTCSETEFDWREGLHQSAVDIRGRCGGIVHDCHWIDRPTVCMSGRPLRLQWVDSGYGWYGNHVACDGKRDYQYSLSSKNYFFWECDRCICTCGSEYADNDAQKFMNLRPVTSDVENNMVVTGVKFEMNNRVMQIQIQQSQLQRSAGVNSSTSEWKQTDEFEFGLDINHGIVSLIENGESTTMELGKDILMMHKNCKTIHFDHLLARKHHVVTGVRFVPVKGSNGMDSAVGLSIRSTRFDFNTGKLDSDPSHSVWLTVKDMYSKHPNYRRERKTFNIVESGTTNDCEDLESVTAGGNWATDFTMSSWYAEGLGDPVVPVFDSRQNFARGALGAMELELRSCQGCLGYVSMKLYTKDVANFIRVTAPDELWPDPRKSREEEFHRRR